MNRYSTSSYEKLLSCDVSLQYLFNIILPYYDHTILQGIRGKAEQDEHYRIGKSKVKFPHSKHNKSPSLAVDVCPYPVPDNWGDLNSKERAKFYHFAGYVKSSADRIGIKIRWGGDWDGDNDFDDQKFDDLVHYEIIT